MQLLTSHIIPSESRFIATFVKKQILLTDAGATVILFGSRARGDAEKDSDWDFLVLTHQSDRDLLSALKNKYDYIKYRLQKAAQSIKKYNESK